MQLVIILPCPGKRFSYPRSFQSMAQKTPGLWTKVQTCVQETLHQPPEEDNIPKWKPKTSLIIVIALHEMKYRGCHQILSFHRAARPESPPVRE